MQRLVEQPRLESGQLYLVLFVDMHGALDEPGSKHFPAIGDFGSGADQNQEFRVIPHDMKRILQAVGVAMDLGDGRNVFAHADVERLRHIAGNRGRLALALDPFNNGLKAVRPAPQPQGGWLGRPGPPTQKTKPPRLRLFTKFRNPKTPPRPPPPARHQKNPPPPPAGLIGTDGVVFINPWRARHRRRRRSSPPRGCRRRCGSAPWCARRSTGSPA